MYSLGRAQGDLLHRDRVRVRRCHECRVALGADGKCLSVLPVWVRCGKRSPQLHAPADDSEGLWRPIDFLDHKPVRDVRVSAVVL